MNKYKVQNIICITGLAVGFLCFSLCNYAVKNFTYNGDIPNIDRIYEIRFASENFPENIIESFPEIDRKVPAGSDYWSENVVTFENNGKPISLTMNFGAGFQYVDTAFIDMFSLKYTEGSALSSKLTANSVVLFESCARQIALPAALIGTRMQLGGASYTVTGILQDIPGNNMFGSMYGLTMNDYSKGFPKDHYYITLVNDDLKSFKRKLKTLPEKYSEKSRILIEPLYRHYLNDPHIRQESLLIILLGSLILISALSNYTSFQTSLFFNRMKECAVRKISGAGKIHIFWLFYSEIMAGFCLSCVLAMLLADSLVPVFNSWAVKEMFNPHQLVVSMIKYMAAGLLIAAVISILPSLYINRASIRSVIFGVSAKGGNSSGRKALLFVQLLILFVFLTATIFIEYEFSKSAIEPPDTAFTENVTVIESGGWEEIPDKETFLNELSSNPVILNAGFLNSSITDGAFADWTVNDSVKKSTEWIAVSDGIFDLFRVELLRGTLFNNAESQSAVINETFAARCFKDKNPLGEVIVNGGKAYTVTGVVKNNVFTDTRKYRSRSSYKETRSLIYVPAIRNDYRITHLYVLSQKGKKAETVKYLKEKIREYIPEEDNLRVSTQKEIFYQRHIAPQKRVFYICLLLLAVSLVIGLLSIYSAIAMNTEKRRKEVAIRKINGATIMDIITLFGKVYFLQWTAVCLIGCPVTYIIIDAVGGSVTIGAGTQLIIYSVVYLGILGIIALTVISHILKVARMNPAEVVKTE
jgi:hypothetical protein